MKSYTQLLFLILFSITLQSCIGVNENAKKKSVVKTDGSTKDTTDPTFNDTSKAFWFTSVKIDGTISFNKNNTSIAYLRGESVHNFLKSNDINSTPYYQNGNSFCAIFTFPAPAKQLRVRAVPIYISNFSTQSIERLFRIDLPSKDENTSTCANTNTLVDGISHSAAAYSFDDLCPTCTNNTIVNSSAVRLFEVRKTTNTLVQIPSAQLDLSALALRVDLQNNSNSNEGSCTNSYCEAKGFDCCVEGQCVKDATVKANAQTQDPALYAQAMSDFAANPLSFINYPTVFNICSNRSHEPPTTPTNPGTGTPVTDAQERVAKYIGDWRCIAQYKDSEQTSLCLPSGTFENYKSIKEKLAIACGCPTEYTPSEKEAKCPDWGILPIYKNNLELEANIVDFYCYTPTPPDPIGPITNLNVNVSNRSAPHRFYSNAKVDHSKATNTYSCAASATGSYSYDDIKNFPNCAVQEGEEFAYADNIYKTSPVSGNFNINSVLGSMNVSLRQTQPAKMVAVELGKNYILSATSGYYTPCTNCARDSWYRNFTSQPNTTGGNGLIASGYTTSRDTYSANTSNANYEDTKFGRACYVPVTMLPFSHQKNANLQTQRMNRLKTQAAYYINGYQRDWYGFNKGALIGSFDGVTWFAIGKGRRITSTSEKLYLAINAAFSDLADQTDTIVNIIPDLSANTAANYDYDPLLAFTDASQNMAGSCQQYHQCTVDADCVSQLGWEYSCSDVSQMRTKWPIYDTNANEVANQEKAGTIFEILANTATMGNSGKRCVYRGAGAPCVRDLSSIANNINKESLTCAPNFYCAALDSNVFNSELVRSPNELDDILFGMDANFLGRPLNYVTATKLLPNEVISNIRANASSDALNLNATQSSYLGICRPGRALGTTALNAHGNPDTQKRTDYINQISSCDSTASGNARVSGCPIFDSNGDLAEYNYDTTGVTEPTRTMLLRMQNSCGAEAKRTVDLASAFKDIEGGSLRLLKTITQPILAADACFRRAGSICHTDLDCSPNKMHAESADSKALAYFGGTDAEQSYWKESLVCAQGTAVPALGSANYYDYKLTENRCCREVGKDFTMFTTGPSNIINENIGSNIGLNTKLFSITNPSATNRYSRYTSSKTANMDVSTIPSIVGNAEPTANQWKVINETGSQNCCGGGWIRKFADGSNNWKVRDRLTLDPANFSCLNYRTPLASTTYSGFGPALDGIVYASYQKDYDYFCKFPSLNGCMQILHREINGFGILPPKRYEASATTNLPADAGVANPSWATATPYLNSVGNVNAQPYTLSPRNNGHTYLDTTPADFQTACGDIYSSKLNSDVPYKPFGFYFKNNLDLTQCSGTSVSKALTFFSNKTLDYGASMYLPAYIPYSTTADGEAPTIRNIFIKYYYPADTNGNVVVQAVNITHLKADKTTCDSISDYSLATGQPVDLLRIPNPAVVGTFYPAQTEGWCLSSNAQTGNRPVLHVKAYTGNDAARAWQTASIVIEFMPLEEFQNRKHNANPSTTASQLRYASTPGNAYYYLTKLGRLELNGIPQITYEPIYCSGDQQTIIPGIFNSAIKSRADFTTQRASTYTQFDPVLSYDEEATSETDTTAGLGNNEKSFVFRDKLQNSAIFSSKDFMCCTPLGKTTSSGSKCCSGTASQKNGALTCDLPSGTNLHVYFNKFVSSEGIGEDLPGGGLIVDSTDESEIDFNAFTGEPKMRSSTNNKIEALGRAYCASGVVRNGAAFGSFPVEPYSGYLAIGSSTTPTFPMSIVDSIVDADGDAGKIPFDNGYRWDHHYYCN